MAAVAEATRSRALALRPEGSTGVAAQTRAFVYRTLWRSSLSAWLTGPAPVPRLLAVPHDPFPGDRARGLGLRMGKLRFRGETLPLDAIASPVVALAPDALDYVHGFGWLRDLAAATDRASAATIAGPVVRRWSEAHAAPRQEAAWRADVCAWRLLNGAAHAPLILASPEEAERQPVLAMLAGTARHLDQNAGRAAASHRRAIAWAGVVAAGLLLPAGGLRRRVGEDALDRALALTLLPDGGSAARSGLALAELMRALILLREAYVARDRPPPPGLSARLSQALPALLALGHGDGGLGNWQGAGAVARAEVDALVSAIGHTARPLRKAREWGYQRVATGGAVLIVDAAPPPAAAHAWHGCASTLAFELSCGADRIVVNCGGAAMAGQAIDVRLARSLRATAAHSTLVIADTNSTAVQPGGRLGQGVSTVDLDRRDVENATRIELTHDGYARDFGLLHRRILLMRADGGELRGEDVLLPAARRRRRGTPPPVRIRFHLSPEAAVELSADRRAAVLRLPGGTWQAITGEPGFDLEESLWVDGAGTPHASHQLVISVAADPGGTHVGWRFRRLG